MILSGMKYLNQITLKINKMSFEKVDGVYQFEDYRSFFKFINNYEGDLVVKKYEVFANKKLIAVYNHK